MHNRHVGENVPDHGERARSGGSLDKVCVQKTPHGWYVPKQKYRGQRRRNTEERRDSGRCVGEQAERLRRRGVRVTEKDNESHETKPEGGGWK